MSRGQTSSAEAERGARLEATPHVGHKTPVRRTRFFCRDDRPQRRLLDLAIVFAFAFALTATACRPSPTAPIPERTVPEGVPAMEPIASMGDYRVLEIDEKTWAVFEPASPTRKLSYVITGSERAILFDSGTPGGDMVRMLGFITENPVTVLASTVERDHIGNHAAFDDVRMLDVPENRARMSGRTYTVPLSVWRRLPRAGFEVNGWLKDGDRIDLGGRTLEVVHAAGQSPDAMVLLDRERSRAFIGDLEDYPDAEHLYPAHEKGMGP